MKIDEFLKLQNQQTKKAKSRDEEHRIQVACVNWFRLEFPSLGMLLFSIPNGGKRDAVTGAKLKAEGALAGVADLFLAVPRNGCHGLWIEMKTKVGRQSDSQKEFEKNVKEQGYAYEVCHSFAEFMGVIVGYLNNKSYE